MKKMILLFIAATGFAAISPSARAQVQVHINIGAQPLWGPAGYDYAAYYYMPDIDVYFNVARREYVYMAGGRWVFSPYLPDYCSGYDLYRGYKVVINEPNPWMNHERYREHYEHYRGWYGKQPVLRDYRDRRYDDHPGHGYYEHREGGRYQYDYRDRHDDRFEKGHGNHGRGKHHGRWH